MVLSLSLQDGGAGLFQKQADKLEKQVAEAEKEAGGNQEELELTLRRVRLMRLGSRVRVWVSPHAPCIWSAVECLCASCTVTICC